MSKTENTATQPRQENIGDASGTIDAISHRLDQCRTLIDELLVQLDLAKLDVRDELNRQVTIAENAYLAARSRLSDARLDAGSTVDALQLGLDQLLHDLGRAYAEVEAVLARAGE